MESLIISVLITIILPMVFAFFTWLSKKEENKLNTENDFIVHQNKGVRVFFILWKIMVLGLEVALIVFSSIEKDYSFILIGTFVQILFFSLGAIGYINSKFFYYVVSNDYIIRVRGFKKKKVMFSGMKYCSSNSQIGNLIIYDENYIPLVEVDALCTGVYALQSRIEKLNLLPYEKIKKAEIDSNQKFISYKKRTNKKVWMYCSLALGFMCFLLFSLIRPQISLPAFDHTLVTITAERYESKKQTLIIYDETNKEYRVSNVVYEALDEKVIELLDMQPQITIELYDKDSRYVANIMIDETTYLDSYKVQEIEKSNYNGGLITSYVFLGIGFFLLGNFVYVGARLYVTRNKEK